MRGAASSIREATDCCRPYVPGALQIDAALGEMPDVDEVVTLLSGQYIDYFTCAKACLAKPKVSP